MTPDERMLHKLVLPMVFNDRRARLARAAIGLLQHAQPHERAGVLLAFDDAQVRLAWVALDGPPA